MGKKEAFFIVSRDSDFDTLLYHIRALGYGATRVETVREALASGAEKETANAKEPAAKITPPPKKTATSNPVTTAKQVSAEKALPAKKVAKATTPPMNETAKPDPWLRVIENLRDHPKNRPTTSAALERHLAAMLGKETPQTIVNTLIAKLQNEGVAVLVGNKIQYKIP